LVITLHSQHGNKYSRACIYHQRYYKAVLEYNPAVFGIWSKLFDRKKKQLFSSQQNPENIVEVKNGYIPENRTLIPSKVP
jgi:hypothetical protein